jgi:RecA-family ATPase
MSVNFDDLNDSINPEWGPSEEPETEAKSSVEFDSDSDFPAIPFHEFIAMTFPARPMLLEPWLQERSTSMVYGPRGVGKSFLTLSIAIAVADQRDFLGWKGTGRSGVLYVDGEMAADDLQQRVETLAGVEASELPLYFMSRDTYEDGMPSLKNPELRKAIEEEAELYDVKLIIIDNLSTLWRGVENDAESWDGMQDWLFKLRGAGRSVLLVHHAGKNGSQRGTSRKEDALDVVVALRRLLAEAETQGAAFNVAFEKCRGLTADRSRPFYAHLRAKTDRGLGAWERTAVKVEATFEQIVTLKKSGISQKEIAVQLGISESKVSRAITEAREQGLFCEEGEDNATKEDGDE